MEEYAFQIGEDQTIIIEALDEKTALLELADKHWGAVEKEGYVILLGRLDDKQKVLNL